MGRPGEESSGAVVLPQLMLVADDPRALATPFWNWLVARYALRASATGIVVALALILALVLREAWVGHLAAATRDPEDLYVYLSVVDALLIGSEMVGLSTVRGAGDSFPFVDALVDLAAYVRAVVGPSTSRARTGGCRCFWPDRRHISPT